MMQRRICQHSSHSCLPGIFVRYLFPFYLAAFIVVGSWICSLSLYLWWTLNNILYYFIQTHNKRRNTRYSHFVCFDERLPCTTSLYCGKSVTCSLEAIQCWRWRSETSVYAFIECQHTYFDIHEVAVARLECCLEHSYACVICISYMYVYHIHANRNTVKQTTRGYVILWNFKCTQKLCVMYKYIKPHHIYGSIGSLGTTLCRARSALPLPLRMGAW